MIFFPCLSGAQDTVHALYSDHDGPFMIGQFQPGHCLSLTPTEAHMPNTEIPKAKVSKHLPGIT